MVLLRLLMVLLASVITVTWRRWVSGPLHAAWSWRLEVLARVAQWGAIQAARARPADVRKALHPAPLSETIASRIVVESAALGPCAAEVVTPADWPIGGPEVLYIHGGGYSICSPSTHRDLVARLALASGARCWAIDYALAPEHPFPTALHQCVECYRALITNADPRRVFLAGDSAGGGLCVGVLQRLRDDGQSMPAGAMLLSPWLDLCFTGESIERNARYDYIRLGVLRSFAGHYLQGADPTDPLVSPLYANLEGLPPMLLHAGEVEAIRTEIERFAERARSCGVEATLYVAEGMIHGWHAFAPLLREARRDIRALGQFVRERTAPAD